IATLAGASRPVAESSSAARAAGRTVAGSAVSLISSDTLRSSGTAVASVTTIGTCGSALARRLARRSEDGSPPSEMIQIFTVARCRRPSKAQAAAALTTPGQPRANASKSSSETARPNASALRGAEKARHLTPQDSVDAHLQGRADAVGRGRIEHIGQRLLLQREALKRLRRVRRAEDLVADGFAAHRVEDIAEKIDRRAQRIEP